MFQSSSRLITNSTLRRQISTCNRALVSILFEVNYEFDSRLLEEDPLAAAVSILFEVNYEFDATSRSLIGRNKLFQSSSRLITNSTWDICLSKFALLRFQSSSRLITNSTRMLLAILRNRISFNPLRG